MPGESELDQPTGLTALSPGELMVVEDKGPGNPLVLASRGRVADLESRRAVIEAAQGAGREVEVHVFDHLTRERR